MIKALDVWLRSVWEFWDTHGTRLLGIAAFLHSAVSAVVVVIAKPGSAVSGVLLAVAAIFGAMTHARGTTNAELSPPDDNEGHGV